MVRGTDDMHACMPILQLDRTMGYACAVPRCVRAGFPRFSQDGKGGAAACTRNEGRVLRMGRRPVGWVAEVAANPPEFKSRLERVVLAEFLL